MEYFTLGMETIRVTQSYTGTTSHKKHWYNSKDYADYPIDLAGAGSNQSAYFATVDMKIVAIKGQKNSMTNTIWLKSVDKVKTPSGEFRVFIALTHWNDNDSAIKKLKVGKVVKKGSIICYEGTDGATSNHLHIVCGNADKKCGNGLIKNSNGAWVSNGYCLKPEKVFYIDKEFSKVVETKDIVFRDKPKNDFLPERGYFTKGDNGDKVEKIDGFFANKVKGNYFGDYTESVVKVYQHKNGLKETGNIDLDTFNKMEKEGFKYK